MRVGLFADRLARRATTGVGIYVAGVSRALASHCPEHDYLLFSTPERGEPSRGAYGAVPLATLPWPRRPVQAAWAALGRPRVNRLRHDLDLLHVLVPSVPVPTDLPLVVTVHDLSPLRCPESFRPRDRWLFERSIRRLAGGAAHVVTDSRFTRDETVELLGVQPHRVTVVHPGPPPGPAEPPDDARARLERLGLSRVPFVLFVGELTPRKNPELLVEAFERVARRLPEHRLVLAGTLGLAARAVCGRVARLGVGGRVRVLGHVRPGDLRALLHGAQMLALPSRQEGFGFPVLEAMAAGVPAIVSDRGSLPEVAGDAAVVVPGPTADGLAEAIASVAESGALRDRLAHQGRARARRFSWARAAERLVAVYEGAGREAGVAA